MVLDADPLGFPCTTTSTVSREQSEKGKQTVGQVVWVKMPCWCHRSEVRGEKPGWSERTERQQPLVTNKVCRRVSHPALKQRATTADEEPQRVSQLETHSYNSHNFTKTWTIEDWRNVVSLDFCLQHWGARSESVFNTMKACIHPALFRLCNDVGDMLLTTHTGDVQPTSSIWTKS